MTGETFVDQIERLFKAFGQDHDSGSQAGQRIGAQVQEWLILWNNIYPDTTDGMMMMVVDQAIKDCKRVPSFAELREIRAGIAITSPKHETTHCDRCRGFGHLTASKKLDISDMEYTFAFRCNLCENWRNNVDGLPMWEEKLWGEGYKLKGIDYVQI